MVTFVELDHLSSGVDCHSLDLFDRARPRLGTGREPKALQVCCHNHKSWLWRPQFHARTLLRWCHVDLGGLLTQAANLRFSEVEFIWYQGINEVHMIHLPVSITLGVRR